MQSFRGHQKAIFQSDSLNWIVRKDQNRWRSVLLARDRVVRKKYDELKLINHVQTSEILLIENFTY